ncbi:organic solute transporter Ostalpha-domain-containing protein [Xylariomycetidae sp. FL2044]|nr:organic solute transporter Ostalpha-domain-containing protein [Xylariomycetidae sp. FL2044]
MSLLLMGMHVRNMKTPNQQIHIMKICVFLPIYGIATVIMVAQPSTYVYLESWMSFVETITLAYFFLLECWFLVPDDARLEDVFLSFLLVEADKNEHRITERLNRFRRYWVFIFQAPVVHFAVAIGTCISQARNTDCSDSGSTVLQIIHFVSITLAIVAVMKSYLTLRSELKPHRAMTKLLAFKLLIGLSVLLEIIYRILHAVEPSPLDPTPYLSYVDIETGIPLMITAMELVFFSIFFHYAYSVAPYRLPPNYPEVERKIGKGQLWWKFFSLGELLRAFAFTFRIRDEAIKAEVEINSGARRFPYRKRSGEMETSELMPLEYPRQVFAAQVGEEASYRQSR